MSGGLGNQLFKWANGLRIATAESAQLFLNLEFYRDFEKKPFTTPREFELFKLPAIAETFKAPPSISFSRRIERLRTPMKQKYYSDDGEIKSLLGRIFIVKGNFEDQRHIPRSEIVRNALEGYESQTPWMNARLEEFKEKRVLAVHIRLGDYLRNANLYDVVSEDYYLSAIRDLRNLASFDQVLLFSDDPCSATEKYPRITRNFDFLETPKNTNPIEILKILASSKGIVSTNSTFSWWATYFHKQRELTVIPEKYSNIVGDKNASKLKLPNQIVLKN
jgi:hypothetical protein